MTGKQALVLLSGGLDSATVAAVAIDRGFKCSAITFTYGQRHRIEVKYAEELAKFFGIENHIKVDLPVQMFSSSALSDESRQSIPKNRNISADDIPATYVPARNIIFLSFALAYAEASGIQDIFLGVNALDYSGYPDCRPEFISLFEKMANAGTKSGVGGKKIKIHAPLINLKKS